MRPELFKKNPVLLAHLAELRMPEIHDLRTLYLCLGCGLMFRFSENHDFAACARRKAAGA